mmetsp:Transcript_70638/g.169278  ORF Transcript_70638/g.169278 Transcript_70638/m.169278 type:complete len:570 (-) Transcript_70638:149-1858(-)
MDRKGRGKNGRGGGRSGGGQPHRGAELGHQQQAQLLQSALQPAGGMPYPSLGAVPPQMMPPGAPMGYPPYGGDPNMLAALSGYPMPPMVAGDGMFGGFQPPLPNQASLPSQIPGGSTARSGAGRGKGKSDRPPRSAGKGGQGGGGGRGGRSGSGGRGERPPEPRQERGPRGGGKQKDSGGVPPPQRREEPPDDDEDDDSEGSPDDEDRQHFMEVCYSLLGYGEDAHAELRWLNEAIGLVDEKDLQLWKGTERRSFIAAIKKRIQANAEFLAMLVLSDEDATDYHVLPPDHQVQERNAVKVRTVLRQYVRDWAVEGMPERASQYGPLISALERYLPISESKTSSRPKVVLPGSGLSRLPFEVASRGYSAQGNEFSYHMLQGSKWVLNETTDVNTHTIYPFVLGMGHRRGAKDHLRAIKIPDVCPMQTLCPDGAMAPGQEFSMVAGEFVEVYQQQKGEWDAVLTCFFLDTAKNVLLYIRTIAEIIRPGGLWANFGPLLFHYAEQPSLVSIELSWEEIKPVIEKYFSIEEEDVREAHYTTNEIGLFHTRYRCIYFAAIRNSVPTEGVSKPVF